MTKKNFDKFDSIAASKEKMEKWGITPEELGWKDGEEDTQVEELEDGGDNEEESLSWDEMKNNPEVANEWYNEQTDSPTEEEILKKAGGKWQEEKSQAEKIGQAVAEHINQPTEEQTEELSESPEPEPDTSTSKDLPPKWENKLAEQDGNWVTEEELSSSTDDSVLTEVKENTTVEELENGRKRIDTSSIRAIAELNSLNQKYPDKVNILKTDRKNNEMSAIVDTDIKQLL